MDLKETRLEGGNDLINLVQDKDEWEGLVNMFTNIRGSINGDEFPSISRVRICTMIKMGL
jgi:hypothetical protein